MMNTGAHRLYEELRASGDLAHHFGVSRMAGLFRLRNLTQAKFEGLKAAEEAGDGRDLAAMLALPYIEDRDDKNGFRHRVLSLALEAYRRDQITRAKLGEIAALLSMTESDVRQVLERTGLAEAHWTRG